MKTIAQVTAIKFPQHLAGVDYQVSEVGEEIAVAMWALDAAPPSKVRVARWRAELDAEDGDLAKADALGVLSEMPANSVLGRSTGVGPVEALSLGSGAALTGTQLQASGGGRILLQE